MPPLSLEAFAAQISDYKARLQARADGGTAAVLALRLRHGKLSGTLLARYRPARRLAANEAQLCQGSPLAEEEWKTAGLFQGGKAELTGLPPGEVV